jgi:hypothetical protein
VLGQKEKRHYLAWSGGREGKIRRCSYCNIACCGNSVLHFPSYSSPMRMKLDSEIRLAIASAVYYGIAMRCQFKCVLRTKYMRHHACDSLFQACSVGSMRCRQVLPTSRNWIRITRCLAAACCCMSCCSLPTRLEVTAGLRVSFASCLSNL